MNKIKYNVAGMGMAVILIFFDQLTKYLAVKNLKAKEPFIFIENVLELNYLENRGAAFGILEGKQPFLLIVTFLAVFFIIYFYNRLPATPKFFSLRVTLTFLFAGAIGNLLDRIRLDYVIDFIYFKWINFPVFNVADIYVCCAATVLALLILFYYKEEDLAQIFPEKKKGVQTKR